MMEATGRAAKYYSMVDAAKFVMAIFVVALHANPLADYSEWGNFFITQDLTRIAVPYFFIAAGFFLFQNMGPRMVDTEKVRRYVLRILRLYVVWCLIYSPLILYWVYKDPKGFLHGLAVAIHHFFVYDPVYHLWFLPALALAAAVCCFLLRKGFSYRSILGIGAAFYTIPLLGKAYYGVFDYLIAGHEVLFSVFKFIGRVFYTPTNGLTVGLLFVSGGGG